MFKGRLNNMTVEKIMPSKGDNSETRRLIKLAKKYSDPDSGFSLELIEKIKELRDEIKPNESDLEKFIDEQKKVFEDYWKLKNIINTSIKLDLTISVDNSNIIKVDKFEETLSSIDLVNSFNIFKFDNKKNIYKIIFNGTRDQFLDLMKEYNYSFEIKNKIWKLK